MSKQISQIQVHDNLKTLTPNQYWLLEHQITAFWHGFGISNGLDVPIEHTETYEMPEYRGGPKHQYVKIKASYMQQQLIEYIKWLLNYQGSWNNKENYDCYPKNFQAFVDSEKIHTSRFPIFLMINLLQNNKPKEGLIDTRDCQTHFIQTLGEHGFHGVIYDGEKEIKY